MRLTSLGHAAVLLETGDQRLLMDPWLTPRLDRLWTHLPDLDGSLVARVVGSVDAVLLSHHHFDHHHFPSLALLPADDDRDFDEPAGTRSEIRFLYPRPDDPPRFTGSGLGHQTIPWTLRRLGFSCFEELSLDGVTWIGETRIRTFPSRVSFPEVSFLVETSEATVMVCGDSLLHPITESLFRSSGRPRVDLALIPCHSLSPPGVLLRRQPVADPDTYVERAVANFERYVEVVDAAVTAPSSFGWKISSAQSEQRYEWMNALLFPFTPWQAYHHLQDKGRKALLWGPGDSIEIAGGSVISAAGRYAGCPEALEAAYREVTFRPDTPVSPFDPVTDSYGIQREHTRTLVERLAGALIGTDYWYRSLENGQRHLIRLSGDDGDSVFCVDFSAGSPVQPVAAAAGDEAGTWLSAATLQSLLDAELLFGSAFGLWVGDDNLLSAALHHPSFYVAHVNRWLALGTSGEAAA